MPSEINGPNGSSDLIVRLFETYGKFILNLLSKSMQREKAAPIQKDKTTAESPIVNPNKNPRTNMYFTSPNPSHRPFEIIKISKNGRARARPERAFCKINGRKEEYRIEYEGE